MKHYTNKVIILLIGLIAVNCSVRPGLSYVKYQGRHNSPLLLAASNQKGCRKLKEKRLWSLLFGAVQINPLKVKRYLRNQKVAYKITEQAKLLDVLVTVLGGWAISLSSKTVLVESCKHTYVIQSKIDRQKEHNVAVGTWATGHSIKVLTQDNKWHSGILTEVTPNTWSIKKPIDESTSGSFDLVIFKTGKQIKGKVLGQSPSTIRFQTDNKIQKILKSKIRKIKFDRQISEVVSKVERITTDTILRVIFSQNN